MVLSLSHANMKVHKADFEPAILKTGIFLLKSVIWKQFDICKAFERKIPISLKEYLL